MSLNKAEVFIASRFEEFRELRERLVLKIANHPLALFSPVDLNNGHASHRAPLTECLARIRRSEFVILLLGEEYGSIAPGYDKSFTHLEYEEAIRDQSGTRVLVFCIGARYSSRRIQNAEPGTPFGEWQRDIEKRHTAGFCEADATAEQMAQTIVDNLVNALHEMRFGQLHVNGDGQHQDLFDAISDDSVLDDSDITALESQEFEVRGLSMVDDRASFSSALDALLRPAAVAAYEQREEAQRAITLADYASAIKHLERALEHRPLDLLSNYWLAALYISLGRKQDCGRARELSERASRIALDEGARIRASACYILAARAARTMAQLDEAVAYARRASEVAPRYAQARIELARSLLITGEISTAIQEVREAGSLYFPSLREIFVDPLFRPIREATNAIAENFRVLVLQRANSILSAEHQISALAGGEAPAALERSAGRKRAFAAARQSAQRQHDRICRLAEGARAAVAALSNAPTAEGYRTRQELEILEKATQETSSRLASQEAHIRALRGRWAKIRAYWKATASAVAACGVAYEWSGGHGIHAVLAGLASVYFVRIGYIDATTYRAQVSSTETRIDDQRRVLADLATRRSFFTQRLVELEGLARASASTTLTAIQIFERETLRFSGGVLPFRTLYSGKAGDLVRLTMRQKDAFTETTKRLVKIDGSTPEWFREVGADDADAFKLYRITHNEPRQLVLSRTQAYFGIA
ncbi:DUF4062 domain-containing protein [Pararobbsia alpina]|uniref:DUF4062 domain-containing protein n=1 Tax=Pararobbsia alpina TaxID=621374 RepID=UPI0039A50383